MRAPQVAALPALNTMLDTILVVVAKSDALRELRMFSSLGGGRRMLLSVAGFRVHFYTRHHQVSHLAMSFSVVRHICTCPRERYSSGVTSG